MSARLSDNQQGRWRKTTAFIGVRLMPIAFAVLAYFATRTQGNHRDNLPNLLSFVIALSVGTTLFAITLEFSQQKTHALIRQLDTNVQQLIRAGGIEVTFDRGETLARARALYRNATKRVDAVWTVFPYDEQLRDYFDETLQRLELHVTRVIAVQDVGEGFLKSHIVKNYDVIASGQYEVFVVQQCNYEAMVVDGASAGIFIYSSIGYGGAFLTSSLPDFVQAVQGLIAGLQKRSTALRLRSNPPDKLLEIDKALRELIG